MSNRMEEKWVGIDVSKTRLDIAVGDSGEFWSANNDEIGILKTVEHLRSLQPNLVVVESTGGLETLLVSELYLAGVPMALVNPRRVREFAKSLGLLAKTDKLDARLLARFAQATRPAPTQLPSEEERLLSAILTRRRQLIDMRTAEKNRLMSVHSAMRPRSRSSWPSSSKNCSSSTRNSTSSSATSLSSNKRMRSCAAPLASER